MRIWSGGGLLGSYDSLGSARATSSPPETYNLSRKTRFRGVIS